MKTNFKMRITTVFILLLVGIFPHAQDAMYPPTEGLTASKNAQRTTEATMFDFYVDKGELYWEKRFEINLGRDSIKTLIRNFIGTKAEVKSISEVSHYEAILVVDDWRLDYKIDGKGNLNYPGIYTSGNWGFRAMVTVFDGAYEIRCKDFNYGGLTVSSYGSFFGIGHEVAGNWQKVALNNKNRFREAQSKSIHLVNSNLEKFFKIDSIRKF